MFFKKKKLKKEDATKIFYEDYLKRINFNLPGLTKDEEIISYTLGSNGYPSLVTDKAYYSILYRIEFSKLILKKSNINTGPIELAEYKNTIRFYFNLPINSVHKFQSLCYCHYCSDIKDPYGKPSQNKIQIRLNEEKEFMENLLLFITWI